MMNSRMMDVIYREYKTDVYQYLYYLCRNHHSAEDLMQETFYRALTRLDGMEPKRIKAWLLRVARITSYNVCYTKLLRRVLSECYPRTPSTAIVIMNDIACSTDKIFLSLS